VHGPFGSALQYKTCRIVPEVISFSRTIINLRVDMADFLEDDDDDMGGLGGLFTCEEYVEKSFTIGSMSQVLLASNMSSVWHFLTVYFPGSVANMMPLRFKNFAL
jgi:hypothetical protein